MVAHTCMARTQLQLMWWLHGDETNSLIALGEAATGSKVIIFLKMVELCISSLSCTNKYTRRNFFPKKKKIR